MVAREKRRGEKRGWYNVSAFLATTNNVIILIIIFIPASSWLKVTSTFKPFYSGRHLENHLGSCQLIRHQHQHTRTLVIVGESTKCRSEEPGKSNKRVCVCVRTWNLELIKMKRFKQNSSFTRLMDCVLYWPQYSHAHFPKFNTQLTLRCSFTS